jgi:probable phosphoglycerate mutase
LGGSLQPHSFELVLSSPLQRARDTCALAGYGETAKVDTDLLEWDYGIFEGRTTSQIRETNPDWSIWSTPVPDGETLDQVGQRSRRLIDRINSVSGDVLLFAHGHILRVMTATWLGLPPDGGRLFALEPASISILGYERDNRVIRLWNKSE